MRRARIVLGVTGGIAAYKAASLLRRFTEEGHDVTVVPTRAALEFVGAPTWAALSGHPVTGDVFDDVDQVRHVRLGQEADCVVVAPATADLLARAAHGLADDLLTNVLLTARGPVVLAPAMHTEMWQHPATRANVALLRERGVTVIEPASGRLTGADSGPGRLPEPEQIHAVVSGVLRRALAGEAGQGPPGANGAVDRLRGRRVVVSAGGTREPLDPVRFLGNRSSGKMGYAVAAEAVGRGADVVLVSANVSLAPPAGARVVPVGSALELQDAMRREAADADAVVMAAAVADFRPAHVASAKIKKSHAPGASPDEGDAPVIELVRNPDILAGLVRERHAAGAGGRPVIVGFAAETGDDEGDVLDHARTKLARKGVDLLVANEVGVDLTFGQDSSTIHLLTPEGDVRTVGPAPKTELASSVVDALSALLPASLDSVAGSSTGT